MTRTTSDLEGALHAARSPYATDALAPDRLTAIRTGGRRRRRARAAAAVGGVAGAVVLVAGGAVAVTTGVGGTPAPGPVDRTSQAPERPEGDRPVGTLVVDDSTPFGAAVADDLRSLAYEGDPFARGAQVEADVVRFGCRTRTAGDDCLPAQLSDDGTAQRLVWRFDQMWRGRGMQVYLTDPGSALEGLAVGYVLGDAATVDFIGTDGTVTVGDVDTQLAGGTVLFARVPGPVARIEARSASGGLVAERVLDP